MLINILVTITLAWERAYKSAFSSNGRLLGWYLAIGLCHTLGMIFFNNYDFSTNFLWKSVQFLWLIALWPYYLVVYSWPLLIALGLLAGVVLYYLASITPQRPRSQTSRSPW